jgi:formylglycine-generating enzyme required for sulfatase activity
MWHQVMGTNRSRIQVNRAEREQRPVEPVRWYEALTFCAKLAECTGRHYSLPSQAQLVPGQRLLKRPGKGQRTLRPLAT